MKELSPLYLSEFCNELSLLVRSGVPLGDGIWMMREEDSGKASRQLLDALAAALEEQPLLSRALEATGRFPAYFLSLIRLGETSGKLEESLSSLSKYYENRHTLSENLKRAVLYPLLLLVLLSSVVAVIVTQVLPIFNDVFLQAGAQMSGLALSLMAFGQRLSSASTLLLTLAVLLACAGLLIYKIPALSLAFFTFLDRHWGDRWILRRIAVSRFSMALAMALSSGLGAEETIDLAGDVCSGSYSMSKKIRMCKDLLERGEGFEKSLLSSGFFSGRESRLLSLGLKTGQTDSVMWEIASSAEDRVLDELDRLLRLVEPTLVIALSLIVGLILFSVMLPLMGIMSSIG